MPAAPPAPPAPMEARTRQAYSATASDKAAKDFPAPSYAAAPAPPPGASMDALASTADAASIAGLPHSGRPAENYAALAPGVSSPLRLPSKKPVVSQLNSGGRTLALDTAGALFLSNDAGKHWTAVAAQWSGKAVQLSFALSPARRYLNQPQANQTQVPTQSNGYLNNGAESNGVAGNAAPPQQQTIAPTAGFQLTTADGVVWLSTDGLTWHPR